MVNTFLKYAFYPLMLTSSLVAGLTMLHFEVPLPWIVPIISLTVIPLCFWLELKFPETPHWRFDKQELVSDVLHASLSNTIPTALFRALFFGLVTAAAVQLEGALGYSLWPEHWPLLAQLLWAVLIIEFISYWIHRSLHTVPLLWPLHALHHASRRYYCMIGLRKHPVQVIYTYGIRLTILWLLGTPAAVMTLYLGMVATNSMMQHMNVPMRCGVLNWIFATPQLHRWHHSKEVVESNSNYGDLLIIWDAIFGTRILPDNVERLYDEGLGLPDGTKVDNSYWGHLKMPFVWKHIQPDNK